MDKGYWAQSWSNKVLTRIKADSLPFGPEHLSSAQFFEVEPGVYPVNYFISMWGLVNWAGEANRMVHVVHQACYPTAIKVEILRIIPRNRFDGAGVIAQQACMSAATGARCTIKKLTLSLGRMREA